MNKDLQNLILSYFTINYGDYYDYLTKTRPTLFAINYTDTSIIHFLAKYVNDNKLYYTMTL